MTYFILIFFSFLLFFSLFSPSPPFFLRLAYLRSSITAPFFFSPFNFSLFHLSIFTFMFPPHFSDIFFLPRSIFPLTHSFIHSFFFLSLSLFIYLSIHLSIYLCLSLYSSFHSCIKNIHILLSYIFFSPLQFSSGVSFSLLLVSRY